MTSPLAPHPRLLRLDAVVAKARERLKAEALKVQAACKHQVVLHRPSYVSALGYNNSLRVCICCGLQVEGQGFFYGTPLCDRKGRVFVAATNEQLWKHHRVFP